MYIFDQVVSV